jgi:DNA-binding MarR family transcriptional regulator/GNAT superfamily N-acetyltransferase
MAQDDLNRRVAAVRHFNRFYTGKIGALDRGYLESPYSLTEARVLYELSQRGETTASELCKELGLDAGYASRLLQTFQSRGLVEKRRSGTDGRQSLLRITEAGRKDFAPLDARSQEQIAEMLGTLAPADQRRLVAAMETIESMLGSRPEPKILLRPHGPGDMGWILHRHGVLYFQEYGWKEDFEALVAEIAAKFIRHYDPAMERCWIAEHNGEIAGSVTLVKQSKSIAKLRMLYVEPSARGLGVGGRLVDECIRFARSCGYRKMILLTDSLLHAARRIYEKAGFELVRKEPQSFGHDLTAEIWELKL